MLMAGSLLMTLSMISWVFAAQNVNLGLLVGPRYGPYRVWRWAFHHILFHRCGRSVDSRDLSVARGMNGTMMTVGMLTGI